MDVRHGTLLQDEINRLKNRYVHRPEPLSGESKIGNDLDIPQIWRRISKSGLLLLLRKKIPDPQCQLCKLNINQTNKHVLSNCPSPSALKRYTDRHSAKEIH